MTEDIYKVQTNRQGMKFITMPKTAEGFYLRKVCQDGAVTFLPIKLPDQPISCQQGTPLGGIKDE
jgi:hypothetical protein